MENERLVAVVEADAAVAALLPEINAHNTALADTRPSPYVGAPHPLDTICALDSHTIRRAALEKRVEQVNALVAKADARRIELGL